jgi:2-polyprenyl-6-methoxyphenol hydroxylase-like FAD-dependent oxidoreductase
MGATRVRVKRSLDVGIIGCGTAGAAAALFLTRAGHQVTVYERVPDPGPVGAGIVLQPTGQAVLARLGLHDEVCDRGAPISRLRCETTRGKRILDLEYADLDPSLHGYGLHRGVLFQSLYAAVRRDPSITLHLGVAIEDLAPAPRRGRFLITPEREQLGPHELIVVADGARSRLRDDTDRELRKHIAPYPWGALWCVVEDPQDRHAGRLYQVVAGTHRMIGLLPTGVGPAEGATTPLVSLYYSLRADRVDAWRLAGLSAFQEDVLRHVPSAAPVLDRINSIEQILFAAYQHVAMYPWHTDDVVYLGDAAHAMSPQLGQGCNLALVDAMVLADCLAEEAHLPLALTLYSERRRAHLRWFQLATRWLTPFFQSDSALLGWLRDTFMPLADRVPPARRLMVRSMAGVAAGPFGSFVLPPPPARAELGAGERVA